MIIVGDFNTSLTLMDSSRRQKINKATMDLSDTIDWLDLTDIYMTLDPKTAEYTSLQSTHGNSSRIEQMVSHETSINKLKK